MRPLLLCLMSTSLACGAAPQHRELRRPAPPRFVAAPSEPIHGSADVEEPPPDATFEPTSAHTAPTELGHGLVITGATDARLLLFTFDDGPDPRTTPAVLDALDAAGVRAVFFVVPGRLARGGARGMEEAELVREIARRGHFVGSHGLNHRHLHLLAEDELRAEVIGAEEALTSVLGERPWLFRPPGGARSAASDALLSERGYTQMLWNVITADFLTREPEVVVRTFTRSLGGRELHGVPGGIVLLHDTHPWTAEALPLLLSHVGERNCELLARGEPLYDTSPDPRWFVTPHRDGDAVGAEAPLAMPPPEVREARQAELRARAALRCPV